MRGVLDAVDTVLARCGGVASRARLLTAVSRHQLDHEIRTGRLASPFLRAWCRPWDVERVRDLAALVSIGLPVALSHNTALRCWQLLDRDASDVHVVVPARRCLRTQPALVVHRVARLPPLARSAGLLTVTPAAAAVASWPLLSADRRRAPVIDGVRKGLFLPADLRAAVAQQTRLAGRRELTDLIGLVEAGCESPLEIWGLTHVFAVPGLRHGVRQYVVRTPAGRYRVDLAYVAERVAVELDGWAFHSSRADRERDMRRDAALAAAGWLTLRFSFRRLHADVDGCRRDVVAALTARR